MSFTHETIQDDNFLQLYFSDVYAVNQSLPLHWHNHLEILYILTGTMTAYINESSYAMNPGDILIVNPRDIHTTHVRDDCRYYLLQIPAAHLALIDSDWKLLHFGEYLPGSPDKASTNHSLSLLLESLFRLDREQEPGYRLLFLAQIYELLYLLYRQDSTRLSAKSKSKTERDFLRIEQSMQYVKKNYRKQFSLEDVANELSLSPEYFCRIFRKYTGQTFFTYVNQVRLLHFHEDLLHTDESITYLLDKHGINNYKVFMREFKKAYGTTPHRLRKSICVNSLRNPES